MAKEKGRISLVARSEWPLVPYKVLESAQERAQAMPRSRMPLAHSFCRAMAALRSGGTVLRHGFDGAKVLPFSAMPGPKWPVLGALPTFLSFGFRRMHEYYKHIYDTYGVVADASILNERTIILQDPREIRKVFQQEGRYPKGIVTDAWFQHHIAKKRNLPLPGMAYEGEQWHRARQALQKLRLQ